MVGVIMGAEVITMDGVEAEATITGGGTIIAIGNDCWSPLRLGQTAIRLALIGTLRRSRHPQKRADECVSAGQGRRK